MGGEYYINVANLQRGGERLLVDNKRERARERKKNEGKILRL